MGVWVGSGELAQKDDGQGRRRGQECNNEESMGMGGTWFVVLGGRGNAGLGAAATDVWVVVEERICYSERRIRGGIIVPPSWPGLGNRRGENR